MLRLSNDIEAVRKGMIGKRLQNDYHGSRNERLMEAMMDPLDDNIISTHRIIISGIKIAIALEKLQIK